MPLTIAWGTADHGDSGWSRRGPRAGRAPEFGQLYKQGSEAVASRRGRYETPLRSGDGSRDSEADDADSLEPGRASARPNRAHQVVLGSRCNETVDGNRYREPTTAHHGADSLALGRASARHPSRPNRSQCPSGWFWPAPPPCAAGLRVPERPRWGGRRPRADAARSRDRLANQSRASIMQHAIWVRRPDPLSGAPTLVSD